MGRYNEIDFNFENNKLDFAEKTFLKEENERLKNKVKELNKKIQKNKNRDNR